MPEDAPASEAPGEPEGGGEPAPADEVPADAPVEEPEADVPPEALDPTAVPVAPAIPEEPPAPVARSWSEAELERARAAAEALLEGARAHGLDEHWVASHVDTSVGGATARARWAQALRPFGPLESTLARGDGVTEVIAGPDYLRAVLDTEPTLSVVVHPGADDVMQLVTVELTTCTRCDERRRFVEDLIAQVRRTGVLGDRMLPDLELDLPSQSTKDGWAALLASRMQADATLAQQIGGASVERTRGEVVDVRYPSGDLDTWHVIQNPRGWGIAYEDLAPSSPIRMSLWESRKWRKLATRQEAAVSSWVPTWRTTGLGAGRVVGHAAIGGTIDPHDDSVLLVVLDDHVPAAALFRVDPVASEVVRRWRIPLPDIDDVATSTTRRTSWRLAFDRSVHDAALLAFGRAWIVDTETDIVREAARSKAIVAVAWDDAGRLYRVQGSSTLAGPSDAPVRPSAEDAIAAWADGAWTSVVTEPGRVVSWRAGIDDPIVADACPYGAVAAAPHPVSGAWLVACRDGDHRRYVLVHQPGAGVEPVGFEGADGDALAWSPDGRFLALPMPSASEAGMVVWDVAEARPVVVVGSRPAVAAAFSADGDALLVVDEGGEAVLWDLVAARRRGAVLTWPPADAP